MSSNRPLGTSRLVASALGAALFAGGLGVALLTGCSVKEEGGAHPGSSAAASNKNAGALLLDAGDAMEKSDWKAALASLDLVLADAKATVEEKSIAWQDKVVCEGRMHGDAAASAALKKIEDGKVELEAKYYFKMIEGLSEGGQLTAALGVVELCTTKYKGDPKLHKQLKRLAKQLNAKLIAAGDTAGSEKLKSLGYLGGSDDE